MAYKIVWTIKAVDGYDAIINYLELNWTDKEIVNFIKETERIFALLSKHPETFQRSIKHKTLYHGLLNRLTLFTYRIKINKKEIQILTVRSTRQKV